MKIPENITSMFNRAEELIDDLMKEYKKCIESDNISEKAKNITHEIIEKYRNILDHSFRIYWDKKYSCLCKDEYVPVYFPIYEKSSSFENRLERQKMKNLKSQDPDMYNFLLNRQVFTNKKYQWLFDLSRMAGKGKHERFSEQVRKNFNIHLIESFGGKMSWAEDLGKTRETDDVKDKMVDEMIQRAKKDPSISHKIRKSVSFRLKDDERDAITFLEATRTNMFFLISEFFELI